MTARVSRPTQPTPDAPIVLTEPASEPCSLVRTSRTPTSQRSHDHTPETNSRRRSGRLDHETSLLRSQFVDEFGEALGIVTLEDILEEIVGDFTHQDLAHSPEIHPQADGTQIIDGTANIREINKALDWHLPCDGPKTLNGLITEALENLPDSSVCLKIGPYRLEVLQLAENRVKSVRIWPASLKPAAVAEV